MSHLPNFSLILPSASFPASPAWEEAMTAFLCFLYASMLSLLFQYSFFSSVLVTRGVIQKKR